jgi:xanthine dehydrogenase accessory factor
VKELFDLIEARGRARHVPHVVATVLRVEGSSYRRPGARMLVNMHGRVAGSISGGCLEKAVIAEAKRALLDGAPRVLAFDTSDQDDLALGASLGCQGKIWIGLEVLPANEPWMIESVVEEVFQRRKSAILLTKIIESETTPRFECAAFSASGADAAMLDLMKSRKTRFVRDDDGNGLLMEWLAPPLSLWLFGAGPDVAPMIHLATGLGHMVTVIDRRPDFAAAENFPGAHRVLAAKPHQLNGKLEADEQTAAVLMNHHYDTDRDMLAALIPFNLPYIAMLGPKRRTTRILDELAAEGHEVASLTEALHGPAGLDIGSETPEEIALAILAEVQATLAHRQGGKLRHRAAPIHAEGFTRDKIPCALPD